MNCVYDAFEQHLEYIGEPNYASIFDYYKKLKTMSHGEKAQYTFAGLVPWFYWQMLWEHNLRSPNTIEMKIQRSYLPSQAYMPQATEIQRALLMETSFWGKFEPVTVAPAIYCMLNEQHAYFGEEVPSYPGARILFAVQLIIKYKKGINGSKGDK